MIVEYYTKSVHAVSSKKNKKKIFGITLINIRLTLNPYPNPESPEFTPTPPPCRHACCSKTFSAHGKTLARVA